MVFPKATPSLKIQPNLNSGVILHSANVLQSYSIYHIMDAWKGLAARTVGFGALCNDHRGSWGSRLVRR